MKSLIFIIIFFTASFSSHAAFSVRSGLQPQIPTGATCTDFESCAGLFHNLDGYVLTGEFQISYPDLVKATYRRPNGDLRVFSASFNISSDCYMSSEIGMVCGLDCNSSDSCLAFASQGCPSGYVSQFEFTNVANWVHSCGSFEDTGSIPDISQLPDEAILTSTLKGDRGLQGQAGQDGADGKDGIDGIDGEDGENGTNGIDGVNGADGLNGLNGANGINGKDGVDGTNGTNGVDGTDGINGTNGTDGKDGKDGVVDPLVLQQVQSNENNISDLFDDLSFLDQSMNMVVNDVVRNNQEISLLTQDNTLQDQQISMLEVAIQAVDTSDGVDGTDGIDGVDGKDGVDGVDGKDGVDGADGEGCYTTTSTSHVTQVICGESSSSIENGRDGVDGKDGAVGVDGQDGSVLNLQAVADSINDGFGYIKSPYNFSSSVSNSEAYNGFFTAESILNNDIAVGNYKELIKRENSTFHDVIKGKFTFNASSSGYESRNLDLGQWGQHDISISRITQHFGGLANIIYFLASLMALTIVLSGIKV
ncbi:hypothetical protein ACM9HF_20095 [Colwellia sp. RE-S-Sl-9]